jgi:diguanylate cyclase (GGDEF)-like protein
VVEDQAGDAEQRIADLVLRGHGGQVPRERQFRRADGSRFWGEVNGQSHTDADGRVRGVVVSIADITERREAAARIRHLALHDHLTGLANRPYFLQRATQALELASRHQRRMALLFIDLDRFKAVNDAHGHEAGDAVLVATAQRLQALLRASDTLCRHGGDEFIVLLAEVAEAADLPAVARKLVAAIEAPVAWQGQLLQVSASIGVAAYPDHALRLEDLVQAADDAMYRAKGSGQQVCEAVPPAHDTGVGAL